MCWSVNVRPANDPRVGVSKALIELQINAKFTNIRNYFGDRKKLRANRVRQRMKPRAGPSTEGMPLTSHPHFCTNQPSGHRRPSLFKLARTTQRGIKSL